MDKETKIKLVTYSTLFTLLLGTYHTVDRVTSNLNKEIISYGIEQDADINLVAHRGNSSMYADNSKEGLESCNDYECIDGVECDVRLTQDLKLLLMHDAYIGFKPISELTYDEICSMDLTPQLTTRALLFKGYNYKERLILSKRYEDLEESSFTICTLEDFLASRDQSKTLFLDIKFTGYQDEYLMGKIGELLQAEENVIIQSFDEDNLREMKILYPDYTYQLLISSNRELENIDYTFDSYGIKYTSIREDEVEQILNHGKKVSIWTIDSYEDFNSLQEKYSEYNDDIYYVVDNPDLIEYQYSKTKRP